MTKLITKKEIKRIALSIQTDTSVGMCRNLTNKLSNKLINEHGLEKQAIHIKQGYFRGENKIAEHFYLIIDGKYIRNIEDKKIIVDPTIRQFTEENFYNGRADTYIVKEYSELPKVGLFTSDNELYNRYE